MNAWSVIIGILLLVLLYLTFIYGSILMLLIVVILGVLFLVGVYGIPGRG
jgi:hypothetical protein